MTFLTIELLEVPKIQHVTLTDDTLYQIKKYLRQIVHLR